MAYETTNNGTITGQIPSNNLWPTFGIPEIDLDTLVVDCDELGGLAAAVLDEYGIGYNDQAGIGEGGTLTNLDIKRMDAMTVINMSLIEAGADQGGFVEPMVNPDGEVDFRMIGTYNGRIEDIYYEILTGSFTESPKAVMVTAGRPLPTIKPLLWYPIWGENPVSVYTAKDMLNNCRLQDFSRHATIAFKDPQLSSDYNDGIDNLYEINDANPWDRIVGYAKYINPGPLAGKDTAITYTNSTSIPLEIGNETPGQNGPDMGKLIPKPEFNPDITDPNCWSDAGQDVSFTDGVRVDIPADLRGETIRGTYKDKFIKISNVYVVGPKIQTRSIAPAFQGADIEDPSTSNAKLILTIENPDTTTTRLEPGKHYTVAYEDLESEGQGKIPYVVFTKETMEGDPFDYGKNQIYYVDPSCKWATDNDIDGTEQQIGTVFPHARYKGILVQEIWVTADLETPSITIYDPAVAGTEGTITAAALEIAQALEYYVAPIVMVEPPAPIAYAGPGTGGDAALVDQTPTTDNDPTTAEDFEDREIEQYMDEMQGGGMAITWSFLDETNVEDMCNMLYEHFQSDVIETIYTCGPDCNPVLGGYGERDGIVNAIRYNYTDSGSYTVSVTEGPRLIGNLTPVDGGPQAKMSENFTAGGVVIDMAGDNIHFKLRIDGYGERWAVNMTHRILRKGDVVSCTVHNNPMEA